MKDLKALVLMELIIYFSNNSLLNASLLLFISKLFKI
jgi:hypothetical protein